jgi:hypothetical protein
VASPNPFHFGVVVGINVYPGGYKRLSGPVNDATGFRNWLVDPQQGGLPMRNVQVIVTPKPEPKEPGTAKPTKQIIDDALWKAHEQLDAALKELPEEHRAAARAKSRLYFFVAGHGIMPGSGEAALLDATARRPSYQQNVELQSYITTISRFGAFAEVCAFADCCRSAAMLTTAGQLLLNLPLRPGGPVTWLRGLATGADEFAYEETKETEDSVDPNQLRGYFSKILLAGLSGNAADRQSGLVTASGLRTYVTLNLAERTKDKPVPQKAEFYSAVDMVFGPPRLRAGGRPPGRTARKVVIRFPEWYNDTVELVAPDRATMEWDPADGPWTVRLYDGEWYVQRAGSHQDTAELANDGLVSVQGADCDVDLTSTGFAGSARVMSDSEPLTQTGQLSVNAPGARIKVLDAFLSPVEGAAGTDTVTTHLTPGAYRVIARIGAREVSRPVLIRAGGEPRLIRLEPGFDAAAPVVGSATANETHGELARDLTSGPPGTARLVVILRGLRRRPMAPLLPTDASVAPVVLDARGVSLTLPVPAEDPYHARSPDTKNRALGWAVDVQPGGCRVRWRAGAEGQYVEQALWVPQGYQTILFVPQSPTGPVPAGASVHVLPMTAHWEEWERDTIAVEITLAGLRSGSRRLRTDAWTTVLGNTESPPMLTLLTLHEMVRAVGSNVPTELEQSARRALDQLRTGLGSSPDVAALVPTLTHEDVEEQVTWPPMLRAAHELLLAAERTREVIAVGSLAELVTGQTYASAPWHIYDPTGLPAGQASVSAPQGVEGRKAAAWRARRSSLGFGDSLAGPGIGDDGFENDAGFDEEDSFGEEDAGARLPEQAGAPPASTPSPSPMAVDRVRELLKMMDSAPGGAVPADPADVAERLGMTRALARSCISALDASGP